jgi:glycosyltransferase involved in cell wall biosynthesis
MHMQPKKLSIVVPCYNEAGNLLALLARFREVLAGRPDVELVAVNNGSRDHSALIFACELEKPENQFARLVEVPVNQGYGFGILAGLHAAAGEYLAWTHADLQTDPNDVLLGFARLLAQPRPERCFVRGRRVGRPLVDRLFTTGMGWVASAALAAPLVDINAQPKIFHRSLLEQMHDAPWDFSLDLYALYLARREGLNVIEQPVHFGARRYGEAKGGGSLRGKARLTRRTLQYILRLRRQLRAAASSAAKCDRATHDQPHHAQDAGRTHRAA